MLLENRQPMGTDEELTFSGLAIYHVDEKMEGQKFASYPGSAGYPLQHYKVALLPKDGNYDLEKGNNMGDEGDLWQVGDSLGPGQDNTVFPNTDGYQSGQVVETNLTITVVAQCGNPNRGQYVVVLVTGFNDDEPMGSSECKAFEGAMVLGSRPERLPRTAAPTADGSLNLSSESPSPSSTFVPSIIMESGESSFTSVPTEETTLVPTEDVSTTAPTNPVVTVIWGSYGDRVKGPLSGAYAPNDDGTSVADSSRKESSATFAPSLSVTGRGNVIQILDEIHPSAATPVLLYASNWALIVGGAGWMIVSCWAF